MPNPLAAANIGALPNTGVDPGPLAGQGPQVDAPAMETPPTPPTQPGGKGQPALSDIEDGIHKLAMTGARLRELLAEPGPVSRKKVIDVAVKLVSSKIMSAQSMAQILKDLPEDPTDIREWLQRHATDADTHEMMMMRMIQGIRVPGHPLAQQLGPIPIPDQSGVQAPEASAQPAPTVQ